MHDLDFLVPSALVDAALATELLRDRPLPHVTRIVAHAGERRTVSSPADASLTPWQAWVFAERAGVDGRAVNVAALGATGRDARGGRYLAEPAHFSVAKDHLRLDDPRRLAITADEAQALAASAGPILSRAGWRLDPIDRSSPARWSVARDDGLALSAPSIERAVGDNVAAWQPRATVAPTDGADDAALAWRRCVNEIQMAWFDDPVNAARDDAGRPTVNTLWLSGNGEPPSAPPRYAAVDSGIAILAALPADAAAPRRLETFDGLVDPERADDWGGWRDALAQLDAVLGGVLARQKSGRIGVLTLVLCGRDDAKIATLAPRDLAKFWRGWRGTPSLPDLFAATP